MQAMRLRPVINTRTFFNVMRIFTTHVSNMQTIQNNIISTNANSRRVGNLTAKLSMRPLFNRASLRTRIKMLK